MYPDYPATLEFLCSVYTNQEYYKDDKKAYKRPLENPDRFYRYNALDSCVAFEIAEEGGEFMTELRNEYWQTYLNVMAPAEAALFAGMRGFKIDKVKLSGAHKEIKAKLEGVETEFNSVADYEFNPGSSQACMKYFYIHKKIKPYHKRVKEGNSVVYRPTCDDKALARLARKGFKEAKLIQEIRNYRKLLSTYYEMSFDEDGRMRCSYDLKGTNTSRLSSKQTPWGSGGNHQNLDPRFKSFITPD
jgi:DNA polymerase I-like protein with 3'-5' exonuclease and polymerase domains